MSWSERAARILPWLALATAAVAATRFFGEALWPCPVSCQGGGHYQRLLGVPAHVPAVLLLVAVAALAWRRSAAAAWLAWLAAGASAYFLWLSWMLDLRCPYCLAVHTGVLLTAICAAGRPWLPRLAIAVLAFLGLHFAFHPSVVSDGPAAPRVVPVVPVEQAAPDLGTFLAPRPVQAVVTIDPQLDALRRQGSPQAAYVLEVALDLHCAHCAATAGPFATTLRRAINEGRVEIVTRFLTRRSAPTGADLARHVLAAADPAQARLLTSLLLGTPEGRGWDAVRSRVAEMTDPSGLEGSLAARGVDIDALLAADAARLQQLGIRTTPAAVIFRRSGDEIARWIGPAFDPEAMLREIPFD